MNDTVDELDRIERTLNSEEWFDRLKEAVADINNEKSGPTQRVGIPVWRRRSIEHQNYFNAQIQRWEDDFIKLLEVQ
jgi:hypothetical protein